MADELAHLLRLDTDTFVAVIIHDLYQAEAVSGSLGSRTAGRVGPWRDGGVIARSLSTYAVGGRSAGGLSHLKIRLSHRFERSRGPSMKWATGRAGRSRLRDRRDRCCASAASGAARRLRGQ